MKREIKFRAWNNIKNQMWSWSDIVKDPQYLRSILGGEHYPTADKRYFWTPMQFTGLKDKNGKEIYEGDICRMLYTDWGSKSDNDPRTIAQYIHDISKVCIVEFLDYEWAFNFGPNRYGKIGYGSFHVGTHGFVELVGNRFQNPELIDFNITE